MMKERTQQNSPLVKKTTAVLFIIFFAMFIHFKPYEHNGEVIHGASQMIFSLYNFIIYQTLGIVHEGGHGVCYVLPCPEFIMVLNGTLFQWLFPFLIGYYYKRRGQMLGYYIGLFFLGMSMQYTACYISTSHEGLYMSADKSFLGVDGYHDFNYMLSALGLLEYERSITFLTKAASYIVMFYSVIAMYLFAFLSSPLTSKSRLSQRQRRTQQARKSERDDASFKEE